MGKKYTRFTNLQADELKGDVVGNVTGNVTGDVTGKVSGLLGMTVKSVADSATLTDAEKKAVIAIEVTAASKTITLGMASGEACIVINTGGTNAFTVKNIAADAGTSVAAGKTALCIAKGDSAALTAYVLN